MEMDWDKHKLFVLAMFTITLSSMSPVHVCVAKPSSWSHSIPIPHEHLHERHIVLAREVIDTRTATEFHAEAHPSRHFIGLSFEERLKTEEKSLFLLHVAAGHESRRQFVEDIGVKTFETLQFVKHNSFLIHTTHAHVQHIRASSDVVLWAGHVHRRHKISETVDENEPEHGATQITNTTSLRRRRAHEGRVLILTLLSSTSPADSVMVTQRLRVILNAKQGLSGPVHIRRIRDDRLRIVAAAEADLMMIAKVVADDASIVFIERRLKPKKLNRWTRGILQNGLVETADYDAANGNGLITGQHGLHGQGQVIGIGDSGIDTGHCFFSDSMQGIPFKAHKDNPTVNDFESDEATRRKVVQYVTFADNRDDRYGNDPHILEILLKRNGGLNRIIS